MWLHRPADIQRKALLAALSSLHDSLNCLYAAQAESMPDTCESSAIDRAIVSTRLARDLANTALDELQAIGTEAV